MKILGDISNLDEALTAIKYRGRYEEMLISTIKTLSQALGIRDPYTAGQEKRVAIAKNLGFNPSRSRKNTGQYHLQGLPGAI